MSDPLPKLRFDIDVVPSPDPEQPGFLIRDPMAYTDSMLLLPPLVASGLQLFDGKHTARDLKEHFTRVTQQITEAEVVESIVEALDANGFFQNETFRRLRSEKELRFAKATKREAVHAGSAYPDVDSELKVRLDEYFENGSGGRLPDRSSSSNVGNGTGSGSRETLVGVAAPHVSPDGGWRSYAAAYAHLEAEVDDTERTIVILGTSHYGQPERFGLTRKPFCTPYGDVEVDPDFIDELVSKAGDSIDMEDYCHSIEHSIEFQVVLLRHLLGSSFRIVPILCGPFLEALYEGIPPEDHPDTGRFFDALGEVAESRRDRVFWILGVDLSHVGQRYGDSEPAIAEQGGLLEVRARDLERLQRVSAGDAPGFLELVRPKADDLRWCGFSPIYTFLKSIEGVAGELWRYEQWNIDPNSVVAFPAMGFRRRG